ncbi:uncharacterized protein LOC128850355 [Cuculus canorus]|uniref:uncharacterized protein LOC128850354 n=1 Tax=Cuculus canorus TaxID=55661 RepID=UPI0023AAFE0E|nr:uncharacterized protein LOC128850354 [Cuculus canorus]XP_053909792.1 uncharacterized protein LOC128850354 [Cuculus canorus]XP_053909793.1 uncharacterized protein LOC128850355 [Cuculus canorus]
MATQLEDRCPICLDSWEEPSFVMPCLHQFCYPCILRWADEKPECPLCKTGITSILHSVRADDDYVEHVIAPPETPTVIVRQGEGAPVDPAAQDLHHPGAPQPHAQHRALVGGLQPEQWARLFQALPSFLESLLPWLRATLRHIFSGSPSEAAMVGDMAIDILTSHGMDEQHLVHMLQDSLLDYTEAFVHELIRVAVQRCRREAFRLLGLGLPAPAQSHAAAPQHPLQTGSPAPRPTPSVGVPAANPRPPLSSLPEEEEAQEEPEVPMPGPSTSSQGRERSPVRPPQRTRRRRASSSEDAPGNKRPRKK